MDPEEELILCACAMIRENVSGAEMSKMPTIAARLKNNYEHKTFYYHVDVLSICTIYDSRNSTSHGDNNR